jgi:hypothetical protein
MTENPFIRQLMGLAQMPCSNEYSGFRNSHCVGKYWKKGGRLLAKKHRSFCKFFPTRNKNGPQAKLAQRKRVLQKDAPPKS